MLSTSVLYSRSLSLRTFSACLRSVMSANVPTTPSSLPAALMSGEALTLSQVMDPSERSTPIIMFLTGRFSLIARDTATSCTGIRVPSGRRIFQSAES